MVIGMLNVRKLIMKLADYTQLNQTCSTSIFTLSSFIRSPTKASIIIGLTRQVLTFSRQLSYYKMLPQVVFVLGGPGAGKGTQCQKIVQEFKFEHLSAGDLLREERARPNSEFGELIEKHIKEGSIVPVEITCSLLERAMKNSSNTKFLIDGFPRNKNNLDGWTERVAANVKLLFVLFFDCSSEVCEKRCLDRGAAGSGRVDDNAESLRKRFNTYVNDTMPIIEYYQKENLVCKIDARKSPEEVFGDVKAAFDACKVKGEFS